MALHSLLKDLGEIRKPGNGATQFIIYSITKVNILVPRSLWKLLMLLVRSSVRVCS